MRNSTRYPLFRAALLVALVRAQNSTSAVYTNSTTSSTTSSSSTGSSLYSSSLSSESHSGPDTTSTQSHLSSERSTTSLAGSAAVSKSSPLSSPVGTGSAGHRPGILLASGTDTSNATSPTASDSNSNGSSTSTTSSASASPTLPCENGTQYIDAGGYAYTLYCTAGSTSGPIAETLFTDGDFTHCMPLCDVNNACGGFEWGIVYENYYGCTLFGYNFSIDPGVPGFTVGVYTDSVTNPYINQTSTNGTTTTTSNPWSAAESCNAASVSWIKQYGSIVNNTTMDAIYDYDLTYIPPAGATPTTTLCDGHPRAHGSAQYFEMYTTDIIPITFTTQITPMPNSAMPACTINSSECSYLSSSSSSVSEAQSVSYYSSLISSISTPSIACDYTAPTTTTSYNLTTAPSPSCTSTRFNDGNVSCIIQGSHVQVAYWPVTETGNFLCGNGTTIAPNVTGPRTASAYGTTIGSPGVLLSIDTLYAYDPCGKPVGTGLSNVILTQQTSQISSQCAPLYHEGGNPGTQVNFADYNDPVPYSAYQCMPQCNGGSSYAFGTINYCSTVFDGDFNPILALPTDIVKLQPEWANCIFGDVYDGTNTIWDPPKALQEAKTEDAPTPTTTPAAPVSTAAPTTPHPTTTLSAAADNDPSTSPSAASPGQASSSGQGVGGVIASIIGMTKSSAAANADPTSGSAGGSGGSGGSPGSSSNDPGSSDNSGNGGSGSSSSGAPGSGSNGNSGTSGSSDPSASSGSGSGGGSESSSSNPGTANSGSGDSPGSSNPGSNPGSGSGSSNSGSGSGSDPGSGSDSSNPDSTGSSSSPNDAAGSNAAAIATVGSQTLRTDPSNTNNVVVAGTTLTPGQSTTINNTPISVGTGSVLIGSSTAAIPTSPLLGANAGSGAMLTLGSSTVTAAAVAATSGAIVVAGQTLSPGQTATIDGHTVVAGSEGVSVDGTSVALSQPGGPAATSGAILTAGSSTITASPGSNGAIIVGGATLTPGQTTMIDGHTVSDASGTLVVDGSSTIRFSNIGAQSETVITAGSDVLTATQLPNVNVVVDGTTLSRGGPGLTIDGQIISDGPSGSILVSEISTGTGTPGPSSGGAQPSGQSKGDASFAQPNVLVSAAAVLLGAFYLVLL